MAIPTFRQTEAGRPCFSTPRMCYTHSGSGRDRGAPWKGMGFKCAHCIQIPPLSIVGMGGSVIIESVASSIHWIRGGDGRGRRGDSDETCCWSVGLSHLPLAPSAASVDGQRPASPPRPHSLTPFGLSDAAFSGPLFSPRCRPPRSLPPQGNNTGRKKLLRFWMLTQRSLGATSCAPLSSANFSSKLGRCSSS